MSRPAVRMVQSSVNEISSIPDGVCEIPRRYRLKRRGCDKDIGHNYPTEEPKGGNERDFLRNSKTSDPKIKHIDDQVKAMVNYGISGEAFSTGSTLTKLQIICGRQSLLKHQKLQVQSTSGKHIAQESNNHPISLLSPVVKLLEKLILPPLISTCNHPHTNIDFGRTIVH